MVVAAFGTTTAINYALSGWVDWGLAATFLGGGAVGGLLVARTATHLSGTAGLLRTLFANVIFAVAGYVLYRAAVAA